MTDSINNLILLTLDAIGRQLDRAKIRGVIRSTVQVAWAGLFSQTWVISLLEYVDEFGGWSVTPIQAGVTTMAALWWAGDKIQRTPWVRATPIARAVMAVLMGGDLPPNYGF